MTAVEKYLFTPLYYPRDHWAILRWWESRRPLYNATVGAAGLLTLGTAAAVDPGPPLMFLAFAAIYGTLANLCYCLGPVADLALRRLVGYRGYVIGPVLFRYGLAISVALTLLPIPILVMGTVLRVLF
jgi:hypothetical protein